MGGERGGEGELAGEKDEERRKKKKKKKSRVIRGLRRGRGGCERVPPCPGAAAGCPRRG